MIADNQNENKYKKKEISGIKKNVNKDDYKKDDYKKDINQDNIKTQRKNKFEDKLKALEELELLGPCDFQNFNENRIALAKLCQKYLSQEEFSILLNDKSSELFNAKVFRKKYQTDIRLKYWWLFSSNVITNKSIGFPIIFKVIENESNYVVLFENIKRNFYQIMPNVPIVDKNLFAQIMFQKLFIIYQLYINNCFSDFFLFKIFNVPKTKIIFKVKDIFFEFEITKLVVLSEDTDILIQNDISEDVYISKISDTEFSFDNNSSFIKAFVYTFTSNISMFYVISKIPPIIEEQKLTSYIQGEYACIKNKDNIINVIILNDYEDIVEVMHIQQNAISMTNVQKDQLIRKPITLYNKSPKNSMNYVIGEDI